MAWSYVTGLMSSSVFYQLEETVRGTVGEPPVVLVVKIVLWSTCVLGLVSSFRHARQGRNGLATYYLLQGGVTLLLRAYAISWPRCSCR